MEYKNIKISFLQLALLVELDEISHLFFLKWRLLGAAGFGFNIKNNSKHSSNISVARAINAVLPVGVSLRKAI